MLAVLVEILLYLVTLPLADPSSSVACHPVVYWREDEIQRLILLVGVSSLHSVFDDIATVRDRIESNGASAGDLEFCAIKIAYMIIIIIIKFFN